MPNIERRFSQKTDARKYCSSNINSSHFYASNFGFRDALLPVVFWEDPGLSEGGSGRFLSSKFVKDNCEWCIWTTGSGRMEETFWWIRTGGIFRFS